MGVAGRWQPSSLSLPADDVPVCLIWSALAAIRAGMGEASLRHASRAVSRARDTGEVTTLPFCLHVQAMALIGHSRFDLAYATAEEGWWLALETGQPGQQAEFVHLALIDALRGLEERVQAHVAELQALVALSGATPTVHYAERVRPARPGSGSAGRRDRAAAESVLYGASRLRPVVRF